MKLKYSLYGDAGVSEYWVFTLLKMLFYNLYSMKKANTNSKILLQKTKSLQATYFPI